MAKEKDPRLTLALNALERIALKNRSGYSYGRDEVYNIAVNTLADIKSKS